MNKTKEDRIAAIKSLIQTDLNEKEDKNNPYDILYGNHSVQRNLPIFLFECFKIFLELSKPDLEIDKEEMGYIWQLIKKIENLEFKEKYPYEFFTEDGFIKLLVSYRLFFIKIARSYFKESEFYKTLTKKQKEEYEKTYEKLRGKIITPKEYDYDALVAYYIECMKRKQNLPSTRDLAKGSEYNKDKWNKILKDRLYIFGIWSKLHQFKIENKYQQSKWFNIAYEHWTNEYLKTEKKEHKKISRAKEFNENIESEMP